MKSTSLLAFIRSKRYFLFFGILLAVILFLFLVALRVELPIIILLISLLLLFIIGTLAVEYIERKKYYESLLNNIAKLPQSYLVLETLEQPHFFDGVIMTEAMYDINKSMNENVNRYKKQKAEFKEYIETWVHEVKTPLAALSLLGRNDPRILAEIDRLSRNVDQVLYLARAENAEDDYRVNSVSLRKIIDEVLRDNRESINLQGVEIEVALADITVHTDSKWLKFITQQILTNSLKYEAKKISFQTSTEKHGTGTIVKLKIRDNGIGISDKDLPRIFNKSFTGENGRGLANSTGMGLYIVKTLCDKLGQRIVARSERGKFTEIEIRFYESSYFNVTKK